MVQILSEARLILERYHPILLMLRTSLIWGRKPPIGGVTSGGL